MEVHPSVTDNLQITAARNMAIVDLEPLIVNALVAPTFEENVPKVAMKLKTALHEQWLNFVFQKFPW